MDEKLRKRLTDKVYSTLAAMVIDCELLTSYEGNADAINIEHYLNEIMTDVVDKSYIQGLEDGDSGL